jgi:epoxyqueuosine reductase
MLTSKEIKNYAFSIGADLVGIATVNRWTNAPAMLCPEAHLPEAESVIVMGIHHPDASVEWGGLPNSNYAGPFQIGMIPKLDSMSLYMAKFIESYGEKAIPYPCTGFWRHRPYKEIETSNTASFSHRHAAVAAGLGEFGWNNMLLTPEFGPRQRLVSVITSAVLEPDPLYDGEILCDRCNMCARHCPGNNFSQENLITPGFDTVKIEGKTYQYAKLNRWRCLWGEQFAFDMDKLAEFDAKNEDDLHSADLKGLKRVGGEFGNCLRYCMAKNRRYWSKDYTSAPRRKKDQQEVPEDKLLQNIKATAIKNGVQYIDIRLLSAFSEQHMKLNEGYPLSKMKQHFSTVISMAIRIPSFPYGSFAIDDCVNYVKAAIKVRLSIAAYDIAQYIDNLGYEAMQDWMSLGEQVIFPKETCGNQNELVYRFDDESLNVHCSQRYKLAFSNTVGVQREQQSMTAGQQGQQSQRENIISCAVITNIKLNPMQETLKIYEGSLNEELLELPFIKTIDDIGIADANNIGQLPDIIDIQQVLPGAHSVLCLSSTIPDYIVQLAGRQEADCATTYTYLQYLLLRELIWAAVDLCKWLESHGYRSLPIVDATLTSIRSAAPYWEFSWSKLGHPDLRANAPLAAATGLGQIGRSGILLTEKNGPNQRLIFIITEAKLQPTQEPEQEICLHCGRCAASCPVQALEQDNLQYIKVANHKYQVFKRNEIRCEWARSLCIPSGTGAEKVGWKKDGGLIPENITQDITQRALNNKDPLQTRGYLYPCQIETTVERCMQDCPAGRHKNMLKGNGSAK